jgi:adenylosuccinate synthase
MLRRAGMEFGTTTGRPRRCGWLDLVALKYCCQINGFSSLNLTKLDVLSFLPEIKLGVSYHKLGGERVESFPADLEVQEQIQVCETYSFLSAGFQKGYFYGITHVELSLDVLLFFMRIKMAYFGKKKF